MEKKNNPEGPIPYTSKPTRITPNPYKEIAEIKDGKHRFSFSACKDWLENLGKQTCGEHFSLYSEDFSLIYSLIVYAIEDKQEAEKCNLNLKKGILLTGPIGCGKTTLMNLVKYFFQPGKQYQVKSTRDITFEFEKEGYK